MSTQPREPIAELGLPRDDEWFRTAIGTGPDVPEMRVLYAPEDTLPTTIEESGIIIGGSSLSVYDTDPWIGDVEDIVKFAHQVGKPLLGVCFGHQVVAQALGGTVRKNPAGREFGNVTVGLTSHGLDDPLFEGILEQFAALASHSDAVIVPGRDVTVLAGNSNSAYQALGYGANIRTVQFHPEVTPPILRRVALARREVLMQSGAFPDDAAFQAFADGFRATPDARRVVHNFVENFVRS